MHNSWTEWKPIPAPDVCRTIIAPTGPGVYQLRHKISKQLIQFGISVTCQKRMKSLFPKPYGVGARNNGDKRNYILTNWSNLEYRTISTKSRSEAKLIEDKLKANKNHMFNT